jgi:hypothetical protein
MNPNQRLLALCALGYSDDIDPDVRRAWRRFLRRSHFNPAQILHDHGFPVRIRRAPALDRSRIPYDLGLLGGGDGGVEGLGFGSPEGFYSNVHFLPKDVARLAYALQLDRPGEDLIVRDLDVAMDVALAAVCHRTMRVGNGPWVSPVWALTLTLYHLAGVLVGAVANMFQIHETNAYELITLTLESIERWSYLLKMQSHPNVKKIFLDRADEFCTRINEHTYLEDQFGLVGFCDGTTFDHPLPSRENLNKALHGRLYEHGRPQDPTRSYEKAFNFRVLLLTLPSGICIHSSDLSCGRNGDAAVQSEGDVQDFHIVRNTDTGVSELRWGDDVFKMADDIPELAGTHTTVRFYADKGLSRTGRILPAVRYCEPDSDEGIFNTVMKRVRVSVEHFIGRIFNLFKVLTFVWAMKVFKNRTETYIKTATLLTNLHCIIYPNQISQFFNCGPPTLSDYVVVPP